MKKIVVIAALVFGANLAMAAGGGKVKELNPLYDESGTVVGTVVHVSDSCEVVTAPAQSGKYVYVVCGTPEN